MKRLLILFVLCFLIIAPIASALDNTTNSTQQNLTVNLTTNLTITPTVNLTTTPEEFYGNVTYSDGSQVEKGSKIVAKDQNNKIVGSFIMTKSGVYGDEYKSTPRLLVYGEANSEISFYVNDVKSSGRVMKFNSAAIRKVDIIISSTAKPTPEPTPIPTMIPTPEPTIITPEPTPIPTPEPTTIVPTTIPPTPTPTVVQNDATPKFLGVLLISVGICVVGAIVTYYILTKKMKRDDDEEITL